MHNNKPQQLSYTTNPAQIILKNFKFPDNTLSASEKDEWKFILFDSIITEYDARRLYWHLRNNHQQTFYLLNDELNLWLMDEIDHAYGFSLIYSSFTNEPLQQVALSLETRPSNFSLIDDYFEDPLKLLILLAYDELVTTHVYSRSIGKYDALKCEHLSNWIRKLKKDETKHFLTFITKAAILFPHRKNEIDSILISIYQDDFSTLNYSGTFLLDHNTPDFPLPRNYVENTILPTIARKFEDTLN